MSGGEVGDHELDDHEFDDHEFDDHEFDDEWFRFIWRDAYKAFHEPAEGGAATAALKIASLARVLSLELRQACDAEFVNEGLTSAATSFLDWIGNLFDAPERADRLVGMPFRARLVKAKGWKSIAISEAMLRRRAAAERVYQLMARQAATTGARPSQKKAIGDVREETGMAVSNIKQGLKEYSEAMEPFHEDAWAKGQPVRVTRARMREWLLGLAAARLAESPENPCE